MLRGVAGGGRGAEDVGKGSASRAVLAERLGTGPSRTEMLSEAGRMGRAFSREEARKWRPETVRHGACQSRQEVPGRARRPRSLEGIPKASCGGLRHLDHVLK